MKGSECGKVEVGHGGYVTQRFVLGFKQGFKSN